MKAPQLETARLYLQPFQAKDTHPIQQIFPQWEIVCHLATRGSMFFPRR